MGKLNGAAIRTAQAKGGFEDEATPREKIEAPIAAQQFEAALREALKNRGYEEQDNDGDAGASSSEE